MIIYWRVNKHTDHMTKGLYILFINSRVYNCVCYRAFRARSLSGTGNGFKFLSLREQGAYLNGVWAGQLYAYGKDGRSHLTVSKEQ